MAWLLGRVCACYAKVEPHDIQTVLDRSERSGVFVSRLAKECARAHVEWVEKGTLDDLAYLEKVSTTAAFRKTAVCWRPGGGNNLGCRLSQQPAEGVVGMWRAKGVPVAWNEADLLKVLHEAGWRDVLVVAYPTPKVRPWLLKAKPPKDVSGFCAAVQAEKVLLTLEKAAGSDLQGFQKIVAKPRRGLLSEVISPLPVVDVGDEEMVAAGGDANVAGDTQIDPESPSGTHWC